MGYNLWGCKRAGHDWETKTITRRIDKVDSLKPLNTWHVLFLFLILECKGHTSLEIWWESRIKGGGHATRLGSHSFPWHISVNLERHRGLPKCIKSPTSSTEAVGRMGRGWWPLVSSGFVWVQIPSLIVWPWLTGFCLVSCKMGLNAYLQGCLKNAWITCILGIVPWWIASAQWIIVMTIIELKLVRLRQ